MKLNEHPVDAQAGTNGGTSAGARLRRIALISDHASPLAAPGSIDCGGQNVYVANLARELALAGYLVDIFTRRDAPTQRQPVHPFAKLQNVRVIHVPAGPAHHVPKEQMLPFIPDFARFVARFARRQPVPYDIVHANFFMSGMVAEHLKDALGIPFVITFHALGHVRRLAQGAADAFPPERTRIETTLMRRADRIIAECAQDRLDMEQLYGALPSRITVAPCGFDPEELWPVPQAQARARLGLEQGRFTILQLGRMVPRKGVDTVIQGLAMLRERHGIDALLLVVGGEHGQPQGQPSGQASGRPDGDGDPEVARLQALARQLGIEAHVRFVGQQPRGALRHYYSAADAFVTTPWYEPFGITPVEAMACARPVVGSEVGGIKSTVIDGVTGLLIPSRDPRALAERLAQLHADPLLARRMGEEGLRRAYRHYTWRSVASQAAAVYAAVLDEYRASTAPSLPTLQEKIMDLTHEPQDPHGAQGRRQAGQQDGQQDGQQEGQNRSAAPSSLRGKTVFITGAASGLGAALATVLARCGADIVATDIRPAALDAAAAALRELGVRVHTIGFDVADPGAVRRAIDEAFETMGRLDILINNAGTDVTLPIDELSEAEWLRVIDTNLNGPFLLAKHAAALMRQFGSGHIINVASTAAKRAWPNAAAYHASKWGLLGLSHALHAELRAHNIRVTAVVAGGMRTPFLLDRFPELDPAGLQDPMNVAEAIRSVLLMPQETVIAELTVLPMRETSWP